jgi:nucleoside-diphosphate kinase
MAVERTLVLIKPDAVGRGLIGRIIARFEERGFQIAGMKLMRMDEALAARHYEAHVDKPFYPPLVKFMTSGPLVALAVQGDNAVASVRKMMGATNPAAAEPGTIRGDFCQRVDYNCVHGSDSPEAAVREVGIFFDGKELIDYEANFTRWI